ncbi:ATP-dependent DNA helicase PIF1, partial [Paramuricea clavata]
IAGDNVYLPLLLRLANDVEENPGPTVYDVVDPSKTICADFSQDNGRLFRHNAAKQCVAMSLTSIVHSKVKNVNEWDSLFLNLILCSGNDLYTYISNSIGKEFLLLSEVPEYVLVSSQTFHVTYSASFGGDLFMNATMLPYYSLEDLLNSLFFNSQYQYCLLTINSNCVSIIKTSEGLYKVFDPHSRDTYGIPDPNGKCVLVSIDSIGNLVTYFQNTIPVRSVTPFEIKGVTVELMAFESAEQTDTSGQKANTNRASYKRRQTTESASHKQAWLENARIYKKRKQPEKEVRNLQNQGDYLERFDITNGAKCTICKEAWPVKASSKISETYVCQRCSRDKKSPRKFSFENSMIPSPQPVQLQGLTQVEEMLIARALPIMRVYIKPGGQRGYSGHCVNLPQSITELATSLPRYPRALSVILVKVKGKNNTFKDVKVRREKVHNALLWLIQNNPLYAELEIDTDALNSLPENGVETEDDIINDSDMMPDEGPLTDNPDEDIVYNNSTEFSSFLPVGEQQVQEKEAVRNQLSGNGAIAWPTVGDQALNEYQISCLATMAFPTLFPDAKGDPTNESLLRDVSFAERIKHLIKYGEFIDSRWVYRFAKHPRFSYWALNMIQRKRILQQSGIFLKQNPGEAHLTIDELREMAAGNNSAAFMSKISRYIGNISGSNAYWNKVREELKAIITNVGAPTIFFTFSSADMHWPELHSLLGTNTANSSSDIRRQN